MMYSRQRLRRSPSAPGGIFASWMEMTFRPLQSGWRTMRTAPLVKKSQNSSPSSLSQSVGFSETNTT